MMSSCFSARAPKDPAQLVPGAVVLELVPKHPSAQYAQLLLVIDPTTWTVARSSVTDASGDTNRFEFSAVNLKAKHAASIFVFSPSSVPTYKVVIVAAAPNNPGAKPPAAKPAKP
jgi:outer membrane lipoprotein-sorting protein